MDLRVLALFPFLLVSYEIFTYLSNDMYLPALYQLTHDLNTSDNIAQLTLTTWFLGTASMQLFLGPLSDRYGRRPILLLGGLLFVFSTIICALTSNITTLLIARFIQGSAVCSVVVAGYSTIHELYESKKATQILALMGSVTILAPAFGPIIGALILKIAGWRAIFWILALCATIPLLLLFKFMPETTTSAKRHPINIKKIMRDYSVILRNKNFMLNMLTVCCVFGVSIAWITAGPILLTEGFHYSPFVFGIYQILVFGSFIAAATSLQYILKIKSIQQIIHLGITVLLCSGIAAFVCSIIFPSHLFIFIIFLMIFSAGTALLFAPLQRMAIEACNEPMGSRMAIVQTMIGAAGIVGSGIVSFTSSRTSLPLGCIMAIAACMAFLINRYRSAS